MKNLSINSDLVNSFRQMYPDLSDDELVELIHSMESDIGQHLSRGDELAFLRQDDNSDSWELIVYQMDIIETDKGEDE